MRTSPLAVKDAQFSTRVHNHSDFIPPAQPAKIRKSKLMIINDNDGDAACADIRQELINEGYQVVAYNKNLATTLVMVMSERPDLILLDVSSKLGNETILCRLIKKNRLVTNTPILLYSALDRKDLNQKVKECEAQGFIRKSWNRRHLVKNIGRCLADSQL
jgi:response regulator RpfG family c-di-GMP phosphodiesterase